MPPVEIVLRPLFWGLTLWAAARLGAWTSGSRLTGIAHLAWDGLTGMALFMGALLAGGMVPGGFRAPVIVVVLGIAVVLATVRALRDPVRRFPPRRPGAAGTAAIVLLALIVLAGLWWNRVPPLFFDSLSYHFAQPDLWLINGRIAPEPWSLHSWFPPGLSVLYGVGLALGGHPWANDANLLLGLLLFALVFDVTRRLWSPAAGLAAVLLLLSLPVVLYALAIPGADLGHGAFVVAALAALLIRGRDEDPGWLRRAALLCGGAVLTKYLGFLVPLAAGVVWLALERNGHDAAGESRARFTRVVAFVAPALLLIAPWLAANVVAVRNPVAPVLARWIPVEGLAPGGIESFRQDARGGLPGGGDAERLWPRLVTGDDAESGIYPTPAWGWLPLASLLALGLAWREDRHLRPLALLGAGLFVLWFLTFRWERFLIPTTFLLAVLTAGALRSAWRRGGVARLLPVLAVLLALPGLLRAGQEILAFTGAAPVVLGQESGDRFLARSFPTMALYRNAGARLNPQTSHVLIVGEMRHYGLPLRRTAPTGFNTHPLVEALDGAGDPAEASRRLRERGYTHLIVDAGWVERSARRYPSLARFARNPDLLRRYLDSLGPPLIRRDGVALFRIPG